MESEISTADLNRPSFYCLEGLMQQLRTDAVQSASAFASDAESDPIAVLPLELHALLERKIHALRMLIIRKASEIVAVRNNRHSPLSSITSEDIKEAWKSVQDNRMLLRTIIAP